MADFPKVAVDRQRIRARIKRQATVWAEGRALKSSRSVRCVEGDHARTDSGFGRVGCANTGSTCICECHDEEANGG